MAAVFISDCQSNIKASTGFAVSIREEAHAHFLQLLTEAAQEVKPVGRARHIGGFTLACAVWRLSEPDAKARHTLRAVSDIESPHHANARSASIGHTSNVPTY